MGEGSLKTVKEYATIAFTLLGVLFGMIIMTFIFAQLGTVSSSSAAADSSETVSNTTIYINSSVYTIPEVNNADYSGFSVVIISNDTGSDQAEILAVNYTINSAAGTITNATPYFWDVANMTYTFTSKSPGKLGSETVQNNSLASITTYTDAADTQFNTVSIAIILVLLIGVFLLFWNIFVKQKGGKKSGEMGGSFA